MTFITSPHSTQSFSALKFNILLPKCFQRHVSIPFFHSVPLVFEDNVWDVFPKVPLKFKLSRIIDYNARTAPNLIKQLISHHFLITQPAKMPLIKV